MNWRLIGLVAAAGGALAAGFSLLGVGAELERFLWPAFALVAAIRVGLQERHQPFRHGFLAGLLAGALALPLTALAGPPPRLGLLAMTPPIALLSGVLVGGLSQLVAHLIHRLHTRAMLRSGP